MWNPLGSTHPEAVLKGAAGNGEWGGTVNTAPTAAIKHLLVAEKQTPRCQGSQVRACGRADEALSGTPPASHYPVSSPGVALLGALSKYCHILRVTGSASPFPFRVSAASVRLKVIQEARVSM